jgi:3-isopropylmalate dehydrogenase
MKIAVLPGDGVGPEVIAEAVKVLSVLGPEGLAFQWEQAPVGGAAYDAAGDPLPESTLDLARKADAILFGAVGGPRYDTLPREKRPEQALLRLRKELNLFANLRPASVFPTCRCLATQARGGGRARCPDRARADGDIYFGQPRGTGTSKAGC